MKWFAVIVLLCASALAEELKLAEPCDEELCQLPDCRCSSISIPRGLLPRDTPQKQLSYLQTVTDDPEISQLIQIRADRKCTQDTGCIAICYAEWLYSNKFKPKFFTLTFDDNVNVVNVETYRNLLYGRQNSNKCPAGATFYVNHEYTNYQLVHELYNHGFEIALHSISHQTPQPYWAEATYEDMKEEFADQMIQMAYFANIPMEELKGIRNPFLQLAGNNTFQVIKNYNLTYDCTWPTGTFTNPPLWPYTLDYASIQDCPIPPCPTASIPGVWVQPMVSWIDLQGVACSMVDGCFWVPDLSDADAWYKFILTNFERHYLTNRAPFGFYVHEWYVAINPAVREALRRFLDLINRMDDVFMVNSADVVDWVKNPIPIPEYKLKPCREIIQTTCPATTCPLRAEHSDQEYWMAICNVCPRVYPWLGNPLGE